MCVVFKPYSCHSLSMFGDDAIHFYLMFKAISQVSNDYITFSKYIEDENDKMPHLERTFAYELYRQWMNLIQNEPHYDLTLNADIDKIIGIDEASKATTKYPDLVLHRSQSKAKLNQKIVCEIKRKIETLKAEDVGNDLFKLCLFLDEKVFKVYKFDYGVFLLVNGTLGIIQAFLKENPKITVRKWKENGEEKKETIDFCEFCFKYHKLFKMIVCLSYCNGKLEFDNLENLFIGKNVKKIGRCIRNDKLSTISVSKNNSYYDSRNDCNAVIHKETATLILGCSSSEIPSQVEIINDNAFRNGHNYEKPLRIIPDGVRKIGNSAFYDPSFRNLVIGKNVEIIEDNAFGSNSKSMNKLTSIYSLNEYPTEISEKAFYADTYEKGTLYVPTSSKINYMGTKGWNKFQHIEEFDPSEFDPTALGISTIQLDNKDNNRIFSLSGQQLTTPKKGLNIINRKKVLTH